MNEFQKVVSSGDRMYLDAEGRKTIHSSKQLFVDQYDLDLEKERNQQRWKAREPMAQWSTHLKAEQAHIANAVNHGGNHSTSSPSNVSSESYPRGSPQSTSTAPTTPLHEIRWASSALPPSYPENFRNQVDGDVFHDAAVREEYEIPFHPRIDPKEEQLYIWQQSQYKRQSGSIQRKHQEPRAYDNTRVIKKDFEEKPRRVHWEPEARKNKEVNDFQQSRGAPAVYYWRQRQRPKEYSLNHNPGKNTASTTLWPPPTLSQSHRAKRYLSPWVPSLPIPQTQYHAADYCWHTTAIHHECNMYCYLLWTVSTRNFRLSTQLPSKPLLTWDDFPWPVLMNKAPTCPEDISPTIVKAYMASKYWPNERLTNTRVVEHLQFWRSDVFEPSILPKVQSNDQCRVQQGARKVADCLAAIVFAYPTPTRLVYHPSLAIHKKEESNSVQATNDRHGGGRQQRHTAPTPIQNSCPSLEAPTTSFANSGEQLSNWKPSLEEVTDEEAIKRYQCLSNDSPYILDDATNY